MRMFLQTGEVHSGTAARVVAFESPKAVGVHPEGPATGQLHQGFRGFPRSQSRNHDALHLSGAALSAITSFPESPKWSHCCIPKTKFYRFVILLPSKHKTTPFRHTAAL